MQELVQNSEQYLTQQQQQQQHQHLGQQHHQQLGKEESDSEGSHISSIDSDAPGQLKHSDSLLLLTQVNVMAIIVFAWCLMFCLLIW